LPVLFVLENNQYSVCSHVSTRQKGEYVFHAMQSDLLYTAKIDGNDMLQVHEQAGAAVARARAGVGPSFLECQTYRLWGHAGCRSQEPKGYRDPEELAEWQARCPLAALEEKLLAAGMIDRSEIKEMENKIAGELDEAFACARKDPLPAHRDLPLHLFCE
jgi:pyruvate dehydrogenase E1 component alpha subunit